MAHRQNQHKPLPPEEDLEMTIRHYWCLGYTDKEIARHSMDHFDRELYGLSDSSVKRLRKKWGILNTRQQKNSFATIAPFVKAIREDYPTMGARQMVTTLRQDYHIKAAEQLINQYLKAVEPQAVKARKGQRFRRKRFWAAGVMDILCVDQHDKWQRFGLWLHQGQDPFPGRLAWMKIWWSNRNPRLLASYYIEAGRKVGGVPLITQSDLGTENNVIANCHTLIRHRLDPSLSDTLQHRWMRDKKNVKPEAVWSQMRRQFTPGFEDILDSGINNGLYDPNNNLERLLFRWLAIPWLQMELDAWTKRFNSSPRRADKHKILPHGIPDIIHAKPHLYHSRDFKVLVPPELFDEMEEQWAPPDDPIFQLVPPAFEQHVSRLYLGLGEPQVSSKTFWTIYVDLLELFHALQLDDHPDLADSLQQCDVPNVEIPLLPNLRDLRFGQNAVGSLGYTYLGGLENPPTLLPEGDSPDDNASGSIDIDNLRVYADFTDEEDREV